MATPNQTVKEQFGSKEKLVSQLVSSLTSYEEESKGEFTERLLKVSNRKLLRLYKRVEDLKQAGGRDHLAQEITRARLNGKLDEAHMAKLKDLSIGQLLDLKKRYS